MTFPAPCSLCWVVSVLIEVPGSEAQLAEGQRVQVLCSSEWRCILCRDSLLLSTSPPAPAATKQAVLKHKLLHRALRYGAFPPEIISGGSSLSG